MHPSHIESRLEASDAQRAISIAFVVFLLTRVAVLLFTPNLFSDVALYANYAVRTMDRQEIPYAEFKIEYPPVSYWLTLPPRWMTKSPVGTLEFLRSYRFYFRLEMFLFDVLGCLLFARAIQTCRPELAALAVWFYTVLGVLLAPILYDRFDAALLFLLMLWVWCAERARISDRPLNYWLGACVALGLGVAHKLVPLVAIPFFAVSLLSRTREIATLVACAVALLASTAAPFALQWMISGNDIWWFLSFHGERGLEVESVYAGALIVLQRWTQVFAFQGPGSWDVGGAVADDFAVLSTYIVCGMLALLGGATLRKWKQSGSVSVAPAILAIVLATILAKVLSAQYVIWLLPLFLVLGSQSLTRKEFLVFAFGCILSAVATTYVFPFNFFQIVNPRSGEVRYQDALIQGSGLQRGFHPITAWVLMVRNLILVAASGWLTWRQFSKKVVPNIPNANLTVAQ